MYIPAYKPHGREKAIFNTDKGTIVVELYGNEAPLHVGNFIELAQKGFYNGTKIHRYEPGFVAQGGDPLTKDASPADVISGKGPFGTGGPGYSIQGEFDPENNPHIHQKGALGMARSMDPNSAGSQFYFTLEPAHFLDGNYTVFGQVVEGLNVADDLRAGDTITSIEITE